jgi:NTE family protein
MKRNKIAIACQGGGSQTAFTAGVLKSILENDVQKKRQIVALSGTSGGAVCAALAWYSLVKAADGDPQPVSKRLMDFWSDNSVQTYYDEFLNDCMIQYNRAIEAGWMPHWEASPYSPVIKAWSSFFQSMAPNRKFYDLGEMLKAHMDFEEIASWPTPRHPVLLLGAANVKNGEFTKFSSLKEGEIRVEAILASAAVPSIFPAVQIGDDAYWDGLFSDNPPTDELLFSEFVGSENKPDEIWIIQVNPKGRDTVPTAPQDIIDRRNEMIGNASLYQDIQKIELVNRFLAEGAFIPEFGAKYKPIALRVITMSPALQKKLDYATKLNRNRNYINELIRDGEIRALEFMKAQGLAE